MRFRIKELYERNQKLIEERARLRSLTEKERLAEELKIINSKLEQRVKDLKELQESLPPELPKAGPGPLIKPRLPVKKNTRTNAHRISFHTPFEVWNELMACGPKQVLEELVNNWYEERLKTRETYFISNDRKVFDVELEPVTMEQIDYVRNELARATALGNYKRANVLNYRLTVLEDNYVKQTERNAKEKN